jgi:hypothetical protein
MYAGRALRTLKLRGCSNCGDPARLSLRSVASGHRGLAISAAPNLSVQGKLSRKLSVEGGTSQAGNEWTKQSFLIDTGAQYNPEVCFQLFGEDKIEMLNQHDEGDQVEVSFNLSSREYNGKYYHNIDAWRIEGIAQDCAAGGGENE